MNYVRIILCAFLTALGIWMSKNTLTLAFSTPLPPKVEVSGIFNIVAGFGAIFVGLYLIVYSIKSQFKLSLPIGEINRVIISACILSILLSVGCKTFINNQLQNYVDCPNLKKIKSHYTSRTYAISKELCVK